MGQPDGRRAGRAAVGRHPGWGHSKVARAKAIRAKADPLEALYLQAAQGAPQVASGIQAEEAVDPQGTSGL